MAAGVMGRDAIFRGKNPDNRVQATLTDEAKELFEEQRRALAAAAGRETASDADTLEAALRGASGTRAYLRDRRRGIVK